MNKEYIINTWDKWDTFFYVGMAMAGALIIILLGGFDGR